MSFFNIIALSFMLLAAVKTDDDLPLWSREFESTFAAAETTSRNIDEKVYRLPENVVPLEYDIYIDLYFEERTEKPFSFEGREYIIIQVSKSTNWIHFLICFYDTCCQFCCYIILRRDI